MKNKNPLTTNVNRLIKVTIFMFMLIAGTFMNASAQNNSRAQQAAAKQPVNEQSTEMQMKETNANAAAAMQVNEIKATAPEVQQAGVVSEKNANGTVSGKKETNGVSAAQEVMMPDNAGMDAKENEKPNQEPK